MRAQGAMRWFNTTEASAQLGALLWATVREGDQSPS